MATNKIYIQVDFNQSGAVSNVNSLNQAISSIGPTTQKASQQASQGVSGLSISIKQAQQSFSGMGSAMAGLGLAAVSKQILETTADLDSLRLQLVVVEKSTGMAQMRFAQLAEMAKKPGLSLEPTIKGYVNLMSTMQLSTKEATDMLAAFGKALAQVGGGGPELDAVIMQVTQMLSAGKVVMADLRPVLERLPQMRTTMAQLFKGATSPEEIDKLGISSKEFLSKITEAFSKLQDVTPGLKEDLDDIAVQWKLLAEQAGKAIAPVLIPMIKDFQSAVSDLVKEFKQLPPEVQDWSVRAVAIASGIGGIATAIGLVTIAVKALNLALLANPYVLAILGLTAAATYGYQQAKENPRIAPEFQKYAAGTGLVGDIGRGLQWLNPSMAPDMAGLRAGGTAAVPLSALSGLGGGTPPPHKPTKAEESAALSLKKWTEDVRQKMAKALEDAIADRQKALAEFLPDDKRLNAELDALAKQRQKEWTDLITRVGAKGEKQVMKPPAEVAEAFQKESAIRAGIVADKFRQEQIKKNKEYLKEVEDSNSDTSKAIAERRLEYVVAAFDKQREMEQKLADERLSIQQRAIDAERDQALERLDQYDQYTIQQKLGVAQKRYEIEAAYIERTMALQQKQLALDKERELSLLRQQAAMVGMLDSDWYKQAVQATEKIYQTREEGLGTDTIEKREAARLKSVSEQSKLIRGEIEKTFEYFQRLGEGVFDALLTKSKSVWQAMADFFKTTILTAMKSIFSNAIARMFMGALGFPVPAGMGQPGGLIQLGGGGRGVLGTALAGMYGITGGGGGGGSVGGGGGGGLLGGLRRLLGGGGGGAFGGGGWLSGVTGGPGGTGGFAGPVSNYGGGAAGSWIQNAAMTSVLAGVAPGGIGGGGTAAGAAKGGGMAGLLGAGGLLGSFFNTGSIAMGGYSTTAAGIGGIGGGLAGFASSAGGIGAGLMLALMGVQRGGKLGALMTTGGGALAGFGIGAMAGAVGGPIGMAIGAAIGGIIGLIGMLRKTGEQKAAEEIKRVYNVDIRSKSILQQIVEIAKQQYGGDLKVAVFSPAVREIVQSYSIATGQSPSGIPRPVYPVVGYTRGGMSQLMPQYSNGNVVANPYVGPTTAVSGTGKGGSTYIQLDPNQANALLEGKVVQIIENNGGAVATAQSSATKAGTERQTTRAAYSEPLTTLA